MSWRYGIWCTPPKKSRAKANWLCEGRGSEGRARGPRVEFATKAAALRSLRDEGSSDDWTYEVRVLPMVNT
jgi:hypothetical protein